VAFQDFLIFRPGSQHAEAFVVLPLTKSWFFPGFLNRMPVPRQYTAGLITLRNFSQCWLAHRTPGLTQAILYPVKRNRFVV
jgi:hypothetical protein